MIDSEWYLHRIISPTGCFLLITAKDAITIYDTLMDTWVQAEGHRSLWYAAVQHTEMERNITIRYKDHDETIRVWPGTWDS